MPACNGFLRFTSGATLADLLMPSLFDWEDSHLLQVKLIIYTLTRHFKPYYATQKFQCLPQLHANMQTSDNT